MIELLYFFKMGNYPGLPTELTELARYNAHYPEIVGKLRPDGLQSMTIQYINGKKLQLRGLFRVMEMASLEWLLSSSDHPDFEDQEVPFTTPIPGLDLERDFVLRPVH